MTSKANLRNPTKKFLVFVQIHYIIFLLIVYNRFVELDGFLGCKFLPQQDFNKELAFVSSFYDAHADHLIATEMYGQNYSTKKSTIYYTGITEAWL